MRRIRLCLAVLTTATIVFVTSSAMANELYEYGEYLSSECTTCHQLDGHTPAIPSITGWPVDVFVTVLQSYREGSQENRAMISVAKRLTDEEIEALAVFFQKQGNQE